METASLWDELTLAASRPDTGELGLWAWLERRLDPAHHRPEAAAGVVTSHLTERTGSFHVLCNPTTKTYYRLCDRDFFLWQRMDGTRTLKDLVVAYYQAYGSFALPRIRALVSELRAQCLLAERPVEVYQHICSQLETAHPAYRLKQLWRVFLEKQFAINGLDPTLGRLYRWIGWLFYTWPLQALYGLVSIVGFLLFARTLAHGNYAVVTLDGSPISDSGTLLVASLVSMLFHELAHALTTKHYGRKVERGGFMIYFGMPAVFVDTTDIWLEPKRARLAVTWAGPYSDLVVAGFSSITMALRPGLALNPVLFKLALLCYVSVFMNLNPLLELDGYFLLVDWLEMPMLRRRSFDFLRTGLWGKLKTTTRAPQGVRATLASFSRTDKIYAAFGLMSALWTVYAVCSSAYVWQRGLAETLRNLWAREGPVGRIAVILGTLIISLAFLQPIGLPLFRTVRKTLDRVFQRDAPSHSSFSPTRRRTRSPWNVALPAYIDLNNHGGGRRDCGMLAM